MVTGSSLTADQLIYGNGSSAIKASGLTVASTKPSSSAKSTTVLTTQEAVYAAVSGLAASNHTHSNMVTGSGLSADYIIFGNGGSAIKKSSYTVSNTKVSSSAKSTTAIPTQEAVYGAVSGLAEVPTAFGASAVNQIVTVNANSSRQIKASGVSIRTSGTALNSSPNDTSVPTTQDVYAYVSGVVGKNANIVTSAAALASNDIVVGAGANKTVQKSGYTIGTTGIKDSGNDSKVAAYAAVAEYVTQGLSDLLTDIQSMIAALA
jgi:hypothetical protein